MRVYNRALSATEIKQLYNAGRQISFQTELYFRSHPFSYCEELLRIRQKNKVSHLFTHSTVIQLLVAILRKRGLTLSKKCCKND